MRHLYNVTVTSASKAGRVYEGWYATAADAAFGVLRYDEARGCDHGASVILAVIRKPGTRARRTTPGLKLIVEYEP